VWAHASDVTLTNCKFAGNSATGGGGAVYSGYGVNLADCTFSANSAGSGGALYDSYSSGQSSVSNCIFWADTASTGPEMYLTGTHLTVVSHSDVQNGQAGISLNAGATLSWNSGNIALNPLFVDANGPDDVFGTADDNVHLTPDSPCLDSGNNDAIPAGVTTDLDGRPRRANDPDAPDCPWAPPGACGTAPIVDMGAYEQSCHCPPQDANGDGDVDLGDFGPFQACFNGPNLPYKVSSPVCFCMDANGDADVDLTDFGEFQACFNGPNRPPGPDCPACEWDRGGEAGAGAPTVLFALQEPQNGMKLPAGPAIEWSVGVELPLDTPGLAFYALDVELHEKAADGPLAAIELVAPKLATWFWDPMAGGFDLAPSIDTAGAIAGIGDAFAVPWSGKYAVALGDASVQTTLARGSIDTAGLAPGHYVLILRPVAASVLRNDVDLTGDLDGNFAVKATVAAKPDRVEFDLVAP
jgi:predicted outer membrane repeat protein